ncbi:MAG TPA: hypothetical protein VJC05_02180 [Candidatus Andersenbacteria bacterium]|nr:hypothetical protein [Candidatus Andersenbacteria bacterium]
MNRSTRWLVALLATTLVLAAGIIQGNRPIDWLAAETIGIDKYEAHSPLYGDRTIEQLLSVASPTLSRLDVLIVDFKHKQPKAPIILQIKDTQSGEQLREITIPTPALADDAYVTFPVPTLSETAGRPLRLTLAAPQASREAPYAVRRTADGDITYRYYREAKQAVAWQEFVRQNQRAVQAGALAVIFSALALWLVPRAAGSKKYLITLVVLVILIGSALQFNLMQYLNGDPGGDSYYYLVAADQLSRGVNPLSDWSFRLPFYSLLLTPATSTDIPDLLWGRIVGILAAIGTTLSLILLAKALGFRPLVGALSAALLYLSSDYLLTSVRPRPHAVFTFLLLLATALLFRVRTPRQIILWSILLGLMGMTRQEAHPAIALLGLGFLVLLVRRHLAPRQMALHLAAATIPLLLILSPYFYENYRQYGNPFDSPYLHQTDTPTAKTIGDLRYNIDRARDKLFQAWLPTSVNGVPRSAYPLLAGCTLALATAFGLRQRFPEQPRFFTNLFSLATAGALAWGLFSALLLDGHSWSLELNLFLLAAAGIGFLELLHVGRWRAGLVLSILATQVAIAAWFNPIPRLFQQAYPLVALGSAALLVSLIGRPTTLKIAPLVVLLTWVGVNTLTGLDNGIDALNYPAAPYYVATEAAEQLEQYPLGNVAAEVDYQQGDGIFSLHSYQQLRFALFQQDIAPAEQITWLCQNHIRYVVDNDDLSRFTALADPAYENRFNFLFDKKTLGYHNRPHRISVHEFNTASCPTS